VSKKGISKFLEQHASMQPLNAGKENLLGAGRTPQDMTLVFWLTTVELLISVFKIFL